MLGAWWYLTGGPKGPFQVLTLRGTRGWHVESIVGDAPVDRRTAATPYREADALRIGLATTCGEGACSLGAARLSRRRSGAAPRATIATRSGAATLAAVAALAVFSPIFSLQYAAWLLPWAALAFEGDHDERHTAGVATVAIALTGVIALAWRDQAAAPAGWVAARPARNLVWIDIVVSWLRGRSRPPVARRVPQRRARTPRPTDGRRLPFDAE